MTTASETRPPLVSHVSVGVTDVPRAGVFDDAVLWDPDGNTVEALCRVPQPDRP